MRLATLCSRFSSLKLLQVGKEGRIVTAPGLSCFGFLGLGSVEVAVAAVVIRAGIMIQLFEGWRLLQFSRHPHHAIILQPNLAILLLISLYQLPVAILFRS